MAKIKINCGYCGASKGCKVKNQFRSFAETFPNIQNEYTSKSGYTPTFKLNCPYEESKFKEGQNVSISIPFGAHRSIAEWECDWGSNDPYYDGGDCSQCRNKEICKDGLVTFKNKKYKGKVILNAKINSSYGKGKYIVSVGLDEYEKHKHNFNRYDLMCHRFFHDKINILFEEGYTINFFIKEKMIIK